MLHDGTSGIWGAYIIIFASGLHQCHLKADAHYAYFCSQHDKNSWPYSSNKISCVQFSPSWSSFSNKKIVTLYHSLSLWHVAPKNSIIHTPETLPGICDILSIRRGACSFISLKFGFYLCLIRPLSICEAVLNEKSFLKGNLHISIWFVPTQLLWVHCWGWL